MLIIIKGDRGIHLRSASQEVLMDLIRIMCLEIVFFKITTTPPGANEFTQHLYVSLYMSQYDREPV